MSYGEKVIDDCIKDLMKYMRARKDKTHDEFTITRKHIDKFRFHLLKVYHEGFEQGVYVGKSK